MKKPDKPKPCGAAGCAYVATHKASDALFVFYLCAEHAKGAMGPPLYAAKVEPLVMSVGGTR